LFRPGLITPTVINLKNQIGGDILTCPNPYPVLVIANDGTGLGTANSQEEYCVLWNDYSGNYELGYIIPGDTGCEFKFYGNFAPQFLKAYMSSDISSYTAGVSQIDFDNNGGDDWSVGFKIAPVSLQIPSGVTVESIDYDVTFWSGGVDTVLESGNTTSDQVFYENGNGAGVYDLDCMYNMSDGSQFQITKLVLVDGSGNILASVEAGGTVVNSVSGLVIDISANITQVGVSYPIEWGASISGGFALLPETGANVVLTLPPTTTILFTVLTLDSTFTNDYTAGGGLVRTSITIS